MRFILSLPVFCLISSLATAASPILVQVPHLPRPADSSNAIPLSNADVRYQQIYSASAFEQPGILDRFMFRTDDVDRFLYNSDVDLQIGVGYAATTVATASSDFDANVGNSFQVLHDGAMRFSNLLVLGPNGFDFVLDVPDLFLYDPKVGDLLIEIRVRHVNDFAFLDASTSSQQSVTTRIWSIDGIDDTSGIVGLNRNTPGPYGLVTQFEFFPIPEPSSWILAAMGGLAILSIFRRVGTV